MNKRELIQALVGFDNETEILCNGDGINRVEKNYFCSDTQEQITEEEFEEIPESSDDPLDYVKKDFIKIISIETDNFNVEEIE